MSKLGSTLSALPVLRIPVHPLDIDRVRKLKLREIEINGDRYELSMVVTRFTYRISEDEIPGDIHIRAVDALTVIEESQ